MKRLLGRGETGEGRRGWYRCCIQPWEGQKRMSVNLCLVPFKQGLLELRAYGFVNVSELLLHLAWC